MKKILLPAFIFFFFFSQAQTTTLSQETHHAFRWTTENFKPKKKRKQSSGRWQWYGGFGLYWSNYAFYLAVQPGILYRLTPRFHLGANASLIYTTDVNFGTRRKIYIYGWDLLAMYIPERNLELSIDWQRTFAHIYQGGSHLKTDYNSLFAGAGYRTSHMVIGVKYDLLYYKGKSIYDSPWQPFIRIYF